MAERRSHAASRKTSEIRAALLSWGRKYRRRFPWRATRDRFHVLVAEILLHQTNVQKALPAYNEIMSRWPDPGALATADDSALRTIIRPLGFAYRWKTLKSLAHQIVDEYHGHVPSKKEDLLKLPGVGEYTASAVLAFVGRGREPVVDAPISRVLARIFGLPQTTPDGHPSKDAWSVAAMIYAEGSTKRIGLALMDLAAQVCTFKKPRCSQCPVQRFCAYYSSVDKSEVR